MAATASALGIHSSSLIPGLMKSMNRMVSASVDCGLGTGPRRPLIIHRTEGAEIDMAGGLPAVAHVQAVPPGTRDEVTAGAELPHPARAARLGTRSMRQRQAPSGQ